MLTKKENLRETLRGGKPDRFVNQFEYLGLVFGSPVPGGFPQPGQYHVDTGWGVKFSFPEGMPGPMPDHDEESILIKDITKWQDYVKAPPVVFSEEAWAPFIAQADAIDRNEQFVTPFVAPGIFEQCHHMCEIARFMEYIVYEPEAVHELIEYITDWEIAYAREFIKYLKPDAVYHHDDWGTSTSTFLSPAMFNEFYLPAYKKLYGFYKENGIEVIVHHSDSYAATFVPSMIEMGIDVWQGCISNNNIPELIKKYPGQITFMGGIDNGIFDEPNFSKDKMRVAMQELIEQAGTKNIIPALVMGEPGAIYPGVYETCSELVDEMSEIYFK